MGLEERFILTQPGPYDGNDLLGAQAFGTLLMEYARGNVTAGAALSAINEWVSTPLTAGEVTDLNFLRGLIDAETTETKKILVASKIKDVLVLGEEPTEGYTTRAELKAKIGF